MVMDRNTLRRIIASQRDEPLPEKLITRDGEWPLQNRLVKVITGVRRCGKSTLARQLLKGTQHAIINFDDERLLTIGTPDLDALLEVLHEVYGDFTHLLLDEIQNVRGWELFVNRLQRSGLNIIVTGSNAHLLSSELATHLTGRHLAFTLSPFSFKEYLRFLGEKVRQPFSTRDVGLLKQRLHDYLLAGGFPEVVAGAPHSYLRTLVQNIIAKDILTRHALQKPVLLQQLVSILLANNARLISANRLAKQLGASTNTILDYLAMLEEAQLFFFLKKFSFKSHERETAPRKVYAIDPGLVPYEQGRAWEHAVALQLAREGKRVAYWRDDRHEIDFVVLRDGKPVELIQVCADTDAAGEREERSLRAAARKLRCRKELLITNKTREGAVPQVDLLEWLLGVRV